MPRPIGRRAEIHATFIHHVAERGYESTNLGDIAAELGMSKGTIVHHFGTKAQMLRELEETYMTRQLAAVALMWERLARPEERVAAVIHASALLHEVARDATVATQREVVQLAADPAMQQVRKLRREMQQTVVLEVRRGIAAGTFRDLDPELTVLQMFGSLQWMWAWFRPDGSWRPEQVGSAFVDVVLGGILVKRSRLKDLADPVGGIVATVRTCLEEAQST
ncbi:TetR/AcrR family transcriptional regulator [Nocardioides limicola]|uniref:TetR/AcrR family transcriptional regulator n=1 Tax=Nocardioides limicola TaxID=2803368 RepID=UPI00193C2BBD|nr:TetR/AcrR family transcriptional regulator [Nocardioides sp. DJM-14]